MESLLGAVFDKGKSVVTNIAGREENQRTLMRKKDEVCARECDVKAIILQAEEEQGKRPTEEAKLWLRDVEQFKVEVEGIMNQITSSSSNLHSKARLAQEVAAKIEEADTLLKRGHLPNGLVIDRPRRDDQEILFEPPSLHGQSTTEKTMDEIMELLLMKPDIGKIGVYGMGGVGKTTIMQNIYNKLKASRDQHFDRIIWVTVSKEMGGIEGLQSRIASALWHKFDEEQPCSKTRAAVLLKKLKQAKRFLLVLDDLWEEITLEEIGIPDPDREGNDCKILVTTRRLSVCDFIQTHRNVEVKCLSQEEAWKLFVDKVGDHVLRVPDVTSLAREVVQELEGLPLAIITVGCAMRRAFDVRVWRHTLKELRNSTIDGGPTGMKDKVFKFLRFSYDHLREQVQKCFLYCALYPEDHHIEVHDLLLFWVAEGYTKINGVSRERSSKIRRLAEEYDSTWDWEAELDKGFKILQELKDSSLLESPLNNLVRMHDLIRDMAIQIMRDRVDFFYINKAGLGLIEFPEAAWDEEATKISLMHTSIKTLPDQLSCSNLSTLLLRCSSFGFTSSFFSGMHALQVLDLSFSKTTQLPESLSDLTNLRALFLRESTVDKIPSLAKLKQLQILDLHGSKITQLPEGMEELVNLRYLDLSKSKICGLESSFLPPNVIRRLARLEVLNGDSFAFYNSPFYDIIIEEIGSLKRLTTLVIRFMHFESYQKAMECIKWNKLKVFHAILDLLGNGIRRHPVTPLCYKDRDNARDKVVQIFGLLSCSRVSSFPLPDQIDKLLICDWKNVPNFSSMFRCFKNSRFLKRLKILDMEFEDCSWGHPLVKMGDTLGTLEELELENIDEVEVIWSGAMPRDNLSFSKLKKLVVCRCSDLNTLFTHEILHQLTNIEVLCAIKCPQMENVESERAEWKSLASAGTNISSTITSIDQVVVVPKLRILLLWDLPLLRYVSQRVWVCNSLERLLVFDCPVLKKLPFQSLSASSIIHGNSNWWETLEWDTVELKSRFQASFKGDNEGLLAVQEVQMHVFTYNMII